MQNKPNFQDAQMNVSVLSKKAYEIFIPLAGQKNKPKTNLVLSAAEGVVEWANFRKNECKLLCYSVL